MRRPRHALGLSCGVLLPEATELAPKAGRHARGDLGKVEDLLSDAHLCGASEEREERVEVVVSGRRDPRRIEAGSERLSPAL